jgi:hypothetical protein
MTAGKHRYHTECLSTHFPHHEGQEKPAYDLIARCILN